MWIFSLNIYTSIYSNRNVIFNDKRNLKQIYNEKIDKLSLNQVTIRYIMLWGK